MLSPFSHPGRCPSIHPYLCDAGIIIIRDTNVIPFVWVYVRVGFCGPARTISKDTTTIIVLHDPKPKSMSSRSPSVMKDWTPIVFPLYHSQDCYWISCVKTSVVWKLNVTCGATIELVRALRMSIRAWGEVYIVCYSRWVFVCTDVTCPM